MVRDDVPAGQADTPTISTPMANVRRPCPACRPLPLGMSYPYALTRPCRAHRFPPLRANNLAPPQHPRAPPFRHLRIRRTTQRNSGGLRTVALAWPCIRPAAPARSPRAAGIRRSRPIRARESGRSRRPDRARWYENELGWPTVPGAAADGWPRACASTSWTCPRRRASRRCGVWAGPGGLPVACAGGPDAAAGGRGRRGRAAGAAGLAGVGRARPGPHGDRRRAGHRGAPATGPPDGTARAGVRGTGRVGGPVPQGAAVWLRPPEPGCEVEASLPTLSALGGRVGAPPTSYDWWTRWRRTATASGCGARAPCRDQPLAFS